MLQSHRMYFNLALIRSKCWLDNNAFGVFVFKNGSILRYVLSTLNTENEEECEIISSGQTIKALDEEI